VAKAAVTPLFISLSGPPVGCEGSGKTKAWRSRYSERHTRGPDFTS
jgi:hypothetical protein